MMDWYVRPLFMPMAPWSLFLHVFARVVDEDFSTSWTGHTIVVIFKEWRSHDIVGSALVIIWLDPVSRIKCVGSLFKKMMRETARETAR